MSDLAKLDVGIYFPEQRQSPYQACRSIAAGLERLAADLGAGATTSKDYASSAALRNMAAVARENNDLPGGFKAADLQQNMALLKHGWRGRASRDELLDGIARALGPGEANGAFARTTGLGNWNTVLVIARFSQLSQAGRGVKDDPATHADKLTVALGDFAEQGAALYGELVAKKLATHEFSGRILQALYDTAPEAASDPQTKARNEARVLFQVLAKASPPAQQKQFATLSKTVDTSLWNLGRQHPEIAAPMVERPADRMAGRWDWELHVNPNPPEFTPAAIGRRQPSPAPTQPRRSA